MRLLHVESLQFTFFPSAAERPKYAIASHRWAVGFEASLKDVQRKRNTDSIGYKKVKSFVRYIREHIAPLEWLWIDTCCIDQKNSTELSEAINSMFRWYRESEVCLAFMQDVRTAEDLSTFETSEWFTRAWTLQELLAPATVVFLDQNWHIIGHKGRDGCGKSGTEMETGPLLSDRISTITRIPEDILQDYDKSHTLRVDEKLQWAKHRQATREEDLSYCLLGILGVSMNIRYGDGKDQTRTRLLNKARMRAERHLIGKDHGYDHCEADFESLEEVISNTVSLSTLADQLGEDGRQIRECYRSHRQAPKSLAENADELETFALAMRNMERDRQIRDINPTDDSTLQQCARMSMHAGHRIRSAVRGLKTMVLDSQTEEWAYATLERPEILHYCDELDKAKVSLAMAHQLYMGSRHRADSTLILQILSSSSHAISRSEQLLQAYGQDMLHTEASRSTKQPSDRQAIQAVSSSSSGSYHQTKHYRAKQRWRICISPWFASRTWEFSLHVAQTGWTFNLRTANLVSWNAPIYKACKRGNISEVQALFREGKASPFDYVGFRSEKTLLAVAAEQGHLELCRYLIEVAGFPPRPTGCRWTLDWYMLHTMIRKDARNEAPEMYRLLLAEPGLDGDIQLLRSSRMWHYGPDECQSLVLDTLAFEYMPWENRFELALIRSNHKFELALIRSNHKDSGPTQFLEILGSRRVDARIAAAQDIDGNTTLHFLASKLAARQTLDSEWLDFAKEIVHFGAHLHHKNMHGQTPLMYGCRSLGYRHHFFRHPKNFVQAWAGILKIAGVDLDIYGQVESNTWSVSHPRGFNGKEFRFDRLIFGPNVEDWAVEAYHLTTLPIYELQLPPGSPQVHEKYSINTICWNPWEYSEESQELWSRKPTRKVTLYSRTSADEDDNQRARESSFYYDALQDEMELTQDDQSGIIRLIERSSRPLHRPRSCSEPLLSNLKSVHRDAPRRIDNDWFPGCHFCAFDGSARRGQRFGRFGRTPICARSCAKGVHDYDVSDLWKGYRGINSQLEVFREE